MEKEEMTDVELLVDIQKASVGRPDFANRPNHGAEIDRACMQHAIRNSDPWSLLVEDSKLKMDPYSSVCFDIPGGRKNRRREAADLGLDAPMLCSDAAPADKDADADGTLMEMTLCLRQWDRRPRRLAKCNQAPRRRSRWRRSCHHWRGAEALLLPLTDVDY